MKPPDQPEGRTSKRFSLLRAAISAGVVVGFCCVIVARGHGIGPLGLLSCHDDLRSCVTWGCAFALLASHALSNVPLALLLRVLSLACLVVVWLIWNLELKMFGDADGLAIACITSAPFFAASLAELMADRFVPRTHRWSTITIRDIFVLTVIASGFVLPAALFR